MNIEDDFQSLEENAEEAKQDILARLANAIGSGEEFDRVAEFYSEIERLVRFTIKNEADYVKPKKRRVSA